MKQNNKKRMGFTLSELLITVAIIGVLVAIAIPAVGRYRAGLRQKELNGKAEIIYTAVQNELSRLKMTGQDHLYKPNDGVVALSAVPSDDDKFYDSNSDGKFDDPENPLYYIKSAGEEELSGVPANLMNSRVVDDELLGNHWVIEYDPVSALVYAVFYSEGDENPIDELYVSDFSSGVNVNVNYRGGGNTGVGYYGGGGDLVSAVTHNLKLTVSVENSEELSLKVRCVRPIKVEEDPIIRITYSDTEGHSYSECFSVSPNSTASWTDSDSEKASTTVYKNTEIKPSGRAYEFEVLLDSLTAGNRFTELYGPDSKNDGVAGLMKSDDQLLVPGTDLHIVIEAYCPDNILVARKKLERDTNSLFADSSDAEGGKSVNTATVFGAAAETKPVVITNARHLQNLDASSGVGESITEAIITKDIHFEPLDYGEEGFAETYTQTDKKYFNGIENGQPKFKPINNDNLTRLEGAVSTSDGTTVANISGLMVDSTEDSGLFGKVVLSSKRDLEISNLQFTGETVITTKNAGGLIGTVTGAGTLTIDGVQTFLTQNEVATKKARLAANANDALYTIRGSNAGGMIGFVSGGAKVEVKNSSASVLVGEKDTAYSAGGLIGKTSSATLSVSSSYADCYVYAGAHGSAAGFVGYNENSVINLLNSYAAGYVYVTNTYSDIPCSAGLVYGDVKSAKQVYSLVKADDKSGKILGYSTACSIAEIANVYYGNPGNKNLQKTITPGAMKANTFLEKLGGAFSLNTADSTPYNLYDQGLVTYTYPVIKKDASVLTHYGDWEAGFDEGSLVYYEKYVDASGNISYGFDGANVETTLRNSAEYTVIGDGYGVVYYQKSADEFTSDRSALVTAQKLYKVGDQWQVQQTINLNTEENKRFELKYNNYKKPGTAGAANYYYPVKGEDNEEYVVYPISALTTASEASDFPVDNQSFYYQVSIQEVKLNGDSNDIRYYYYNPDFAKTVIVLEGNEKADMPEISSQTRLSIRTPRQFYAMSKHYDQYQPILTLEKGNVSFVQERNVDYYAYEWANFTTYSNAPAYQTPIGNTKDRAFTGIFDGGCNQIKNISFSSAPSSEQHYVGLFGYNKGVIANVVLNADYDEANPYYIQNRSEVKAGTTVYMGILSGFNEGEVYNCACAGYVMQGTDSTIYAQQSSILHIGCLIGHNEGTVRQCSVASPSLGITSNYARVYIGGFVGYNVAKGVIENCYDISSLNVLQSTGGKVEVGGFAGHNDGRINNSYCATAIVTSGSAVGYGFAPTGGSVNGCSYLNGGTFTYVGALHNYSFATLTTSAEAKKYNELTALRTDSTHADVEHTFSHTNTKTGSEDDDADNKDYDGYPYPAYVTDASGVPVHYGDWQDALAMGIMGVFYWEHEEGNNANAGYHFSYLGLDIEHNTQSGTTETKISQGSSLCLAHDDDNVITEYGYGVYLLDDKNETYAKEIGLKWGDAFDCSLTKLVGVSSSAYNVTASAAIEEQMTYTGEDDREFVLYAVTTSGRNKLKLDGNGKLIISGSSGNMSVATESVSVSDYLCIKNNDLQGNVTLSYMGKDFTFTLNPFFADSFSYTSNGTEAKDYSGLSKVNTTPGTGFAYGVRSYEQMKYINWNSALKVSDFNFREADIQNKSEEQEENETAFSNLKKYPYLDTAGLSWAQSHDLESDDADLSFANRKSFVPIGQFGEPFKGNYNGAGYRIKNLYIKSAAQTVGLFGRVEGGSISNVVMIADAGHGRVECNYKSEFAATVGAMIGMAKNCGTIYNCATSGYQVVYSGNKNDGSDRDDNKVYTNHGWQYNSPIIVGGLVGSSYNSSIEGCSAVNDLSAGGDISYVRAEMGGLVGAIGSNGSTVSVNNCYTGGTMLISNAQRKLYGGITGNARLMDLDDVSGIIAEIFAQRNVNWPWYLYGPANSKITNCYTYCDVPESQGSFRFTKMSALGNIWSLITSIGHNARVNVYQNGVSSLTGLINYKQATLDGKRFFIAANAGSDDASITIDNCYYLQRSTGMVDNYKSSDSIISNNFGITGVSLEELKVSDEDQSMVTKLNGGDGGSWSRVTTVVGDINVPGAYTYPANSGLLGLDYPFPCIVRQAGNYVHYGDWVTDDPCWKSSMNAMDIFADCEYDPKKPDELATRTFFLFDEKEKLKAAFGTLTAANFTYEPNDDRSFEIAEIRESTKDGKAGYEITVRALKTGITVVYPDGFEFSRLSVDVTADLRVSVADIPAAGKDPVFATSLNLELRAENSGDEPTKQFRLLATDSNDLDKNGAGNNYTDYVTWKFTSEDTKDSVNPYADVKLDEGGYDTATVTGKGMDTHYLVEGTIPYNGVDYSGTAHLQISTDVPSTVGISDNVNALAEKPSYSFVRMRLTDGRQESDPNDPEKLLPAVTEFTGETELPEKLGDPHYISEDKNPELFLFFMKGNVALDEVYIDNETIQLTGNYDGAAGNFKVYTEDSGIIVPEEGEVPLFLYLDKENAYEDTNDYKLHYTDLPLYLYVIKDSGVDMSKLSDLQLTLTLKQSGEGTGQSCSYVVTAPVTVRNTIDMAELTIRPYDKELFDETVKGEGNEGNEKYRPTGEEIKGFTAKSMEYTLPECPETYTDAYYEFAGWDVNGTAKEPGDTVTVEGDTVITATWKAKEYYARLSLNDVIQLNSEESAPHTRDLTISGIAGISRLETGVYRIPIVDDGLYSTEHFRLDFPRLTVQSWNKYTVCMWQPDGTTEISDRVTNSKAIRDVTYEDESQMPGYFAIWQGKITMNNDADVDKKPATKTYYVVFGDPIVEENAHTLRLYDGSADTGSSAYKGMYTLPNSNLSTPHKRVNNNKEDGWYAKVYNASGEENGQHVLFRLQKSSGSNALVYHQTKGNWNGVYTPGESNYTIMSSKHWIEPSGEFTLYLKFHRAYQVRLYTYGGSKPTGRYQNGSGSTFYWESFVQDADYRTDKDKPLPTASQMSRNGDVFVGWYADEALTDTTLPAADFTQPDPVNVDLYAKWNYRLTFDANGGKFADGSFTAKTKDFEITDPAQTLAVSEFPAIDETYMPNADAKEFIGWTTVKDDGSTLVDTASVTVDSSRTYYAYFYTYPTVTYDAGTNGTVDGYGTQTKSFSYNPAQSYTDLPTASRATGYDFDGWYDKPEGETGAVKKTAADIPKEGDVTWYAHYKAWPVYTLNLNGGALSDGKSFRLTDNVYTVSAARGSSITLPNGKDVSKSNVDCVSWRLSSDSQSYTGSYTVPTDAPEGTQTFTAEYKDYIKVIFDPNGGTITPTYTTVSRYDTTGINLSGYVPTLKYHGFDCWTLSGTGLSGYYNPGTGAADEITLVARYLPTVKLNIGSGTIAETKRGSFSYDSEGNVYYWTGKTTAGTKITMPKLADVKDEANKKDAISWKSVTLDTSNRLDVSTLTFDANNEYTVEAELKAYPVITFDPGENATLQVGETGYTHSNLFKLAVSRYATTNLNDYKPTKENHSFDYWYTTDSKVSVTMRAFGTEEDVTLNAKYTKYPCVRLIVYKTDDGTSNTQLTGTDLSAVTFVTKDGYEYTVGSDVALCFYPKQADGSYPKPKPPDAQLSGYRLDAWYGTTTFTGTQYQVGKYVTATGEVVGDGTYRLYGLFIKQYTLTFDLQGGKIGSSTDPIENVYDVNTLIWDKVPGTNPTKTGCDFMGWYTEPNGEGDKLTAESTATLTADTTYYACFKKYPTVKLNLGTNGSITSGKSGDFTLSGGVYSWTGSRYNADGSDRKITLPAMKDVLNTTNKKDCVGWKDVTVTDNKVVVKDLTYVDDVCTIEAKWESYPVITLNPVTTNFSATLVVNSVTYPNAGTNFTLAVSRYATVNLSAYQPTVAKGDFDWWYETDPATSVNMTAYQTTKDVTLYARFTQRPLLKLYNTKEGLVLDNPDVEFSVSKTPSYHHYYERNAYGTYPQATLPNVQARAGYRFDGWYKYTYSPSTGSGSITADAVKLNPGAKLTMEAGQEYAYYAKFIKVWTLTFDLQGGNISGNTNNVVSTLDDGSTITKPTSDPTRTNYDFMGWYTGKNGTGSKYVEGQTITKDTTYYAYWKPYRVVRLNLGTATLSGDSGSFTNYDSTGKYYYWTGPNSVTTITLPDVKNVKDEANKKDCISWSVTPDGSNQVLLSSLTFNTDNVATISANFKKYATVKLNIGAATISGNSGDFTLSGGVYSWTGSNYTESITLPDVKDVKDEANKKDCISWSVTPDSANQVKLSSLTFDTDNVATISANFAKYYTIKLNANGGTVGGESILTVYVSRYNSTVNLLNYTAVKARNDFDYWRIKSITGKRTDRFTVTDANSGTTFYAQYTAHRTLKLTILAKNTGITVADSDQSPGSKKVESDKGANKKTGTIDYTTFTVYVGRDENNQYLYTLPTLKSGTSQKIVSEWYTAYSCDIDNKSNVNLKYEAKNKVDMSKPFEVTDDEPELFGKLVTTKRCYFNLNGGTISDPDGNYTKSGKLYYREFEANDRGGVDPKNIVYPSATNGTKKLEKWTGEGTEAKPYTANWVEKSHKITLMQYNGNDKNELTITEEQISTLTDLKILGYSKPKRNTGIEWTLLGWFTKENITSNTPAVSADGTVNISLQPAGDDELNLTLYPKWTANVSVYKQAKSISSGGQYLIGSKIEANGANLLYNNSGELKVQQSSSGDLYNADGTAVTVTDGIILSDASGYLWTSGNNKSFKNNSYFLTCTKGNGNNATLSLSKTEFKNWSVESANNAFKVSYTSENQTFYLEVAKKEIKANKNAATVYFYGASSTMTVYYYNIK